MTLCLLIEQLLCVVVCSKRGWKSRQKKRKRGFAKNRQEEKKQNVEAEVVYEGPINAPVKKGQQLAELVIKPEGLPEIRRPLVAAEDVAIGGFVVRMLTVGGIILKDVINNPLESM